MQWHARCATGSDDLASKIERHLCFFNFEPFMLTHHHTLITVSPEREANSLLPPNQILFDLSVDIRGISYRLTSVANVYTLRPFCVEYFKPTGQANL